MNELPTYSASALASGSSRAGSGSLIACTGVLVRSSLSSEIAMSGRGQAMRVPQKKNAREALWGQQDDLATRVVADDGIQVLHAHRAVDHILGKRVRDKWPVCGKYGRPGANQRTMQTSNSSRQ